jgi:hypothetical protein
MCGLRSIPSSAPSANSHGCGAQHRFFPAIGLCQETIRKMSAQVKSVVRNRLIDASDAISRAETYMGTSSRWPDRPVNRLFFVCSVYPVGNNCFVFVLFLIEYR